MRRSVRVMPVGGGWQPTETAPEDTVVLVFVKPDWVDTAFWVLDNSNDEGRRVWFWSDGSKMHKNHNPVCWMPLPDQLKEEGCLHGIAKQVQALQQRVEELEGEIKGAQSMAARLRDPDNPNWRELMLEAADIIEALQPPREEKG